MTLVGVHEGEPMGFSSEDPIAAACNDWTESTIARAKINWRSVFIDVRF
jgi:hypothetical protein